MTYEIPNHPLHALAVAVASLTATSWAAAAPPPNDAIESAAPIRALPFRSALDVRDATASNDDPGSSTHGSTVWYAFTPTSDIRVLIDTLGSDYDTTLFAFTGAPGALESVAWDDDGASESGQSRLLLEAKAGITYYLMIGAFSGAAAGRLVLSAKVGPPPLRIAVQLDPQGSVERRTGVATVHGKISCSQKAVVGVVGDMQQTTGGAAVGGAIFTYVTCDGDVDWSADVSNRNARFGAGSAHVIAGATGFSQTTGEVVDASTSGDVLLSGR